MRFTGKGPWGLTKEMAWETERERQGQKLPGEVLESSLCNQAPGSFLNAQGDKGPSHTHINGCHWEACWWVGHHGPSGGSPQLP